MRKCWIQSEIAFASNLIPDMMIGSNPFVHSLINNAPLFNLTTMTDTKKYNEGYNQAIKDLDNFDWQSFRVNAAKDILCALIARTSMFSGENIHHGVNVALEYADILIRQLREDEK